jgi:hypothetical protein
MGKSHGKCDILATLVLVLLLGLLVPAGTASASTMNTAHCVLDAELTPGVWWNRADGSYGVDDWVVSLRVDGATGPDGPRFLGYAVACLDVTVPPIVPPVGPDTRGHATGLVAFVRDDPSSVPWDVSEPFLANLEGHGLLWTGTWDGHTLGLGGSHDFDLALVGWPGSVNEPYTASLVIRNLNLKNANWHSGSYSVPGNIQAVIAAR